MQSVVLHLCWIQSLYCVNYYACSLSYFIYVESDLYIVFTTMHAVCHITFMLNPIFILCLLPCMQSVVLHLCWIQSLYYVNYHACSLSYYIYVESNLYIVLTTMHAVCHIRIQSLYCVNYHACSLSYYIYVESNLYIVLTTMHAVCRITFMLNPIFTLC